MKHIFDRLEQLARERSLTRLKHLRGQHDQRDHAWNRGMGGGGGAGVELGPNQMGPLPTMQMYRQQRIALMNQHRQGEITREEMRQQIRNLRGMTTESEVAPTVQPLQSTQSLQNTQPLMPTAQPITVASNSTLPSENLSADEKKANDAALKVFKRYTDMYDMELDEFEPQHWRIIGDAASAVNDELNGTAQSVVDHYRSVMQSKIDEKNGNTKPVYEASERPSLPATTITGIEINQNPVFDNKQISQAVAPRPISKKEVQPGGKIYDALASISGLGSDVEFSRHIEKIGAEKSLDIISKLIGHDSLPSVVSEQELTNMHINGELKENKIMYRGVNDTIDSGIQRDDLQSKTGIEIQQQFQNGEYHSGRGVIGSGYYFASDQDEANSYQHAANYGDKIIRSGVKSDANIGYFSTRNTTVYAQMAAFLFGDSDGISDMGIRMALLGFDGYYCSNELDHFVLLNRNSVYVQDDILTRK